MPRADLPPPHRGPGRFDMAFHVHFFPPFARSRKSPRGKGGEPEREPVEPPRPKDLSGGASAPLEFDA